MKSKMLSSSKMLFRYFSSTVVWLTFGYTLLTFISLPLVLYVISMNDKRVGDNSFSGVVNPLWQVGAFHLIMALIFAALISVVIFNYKNKESSSDYIHSLPVRRETIFSNAVIVGIGAIILPLIATSLIMLLEKPFLSFDLTAKNIIVWALFTLFVQLIMFFISVFVGMIVNSITLHIEMILIAMFLPLVLWTAIVFTADIFFDGLAIFTGFGLSSIISPMDQTSFPVYAVTEFFTNHFDATKIIIWALVGAAALIISGLLYKNRHNERVNRGFNYEAIYHLLVLILTILGMLFISMIITTVLPDIKLITIIVFIFAAVVSYIFVLMFMQDTLRVKFKLNELIFTVIGIGVFFVVFMFGWNHFTNKIPESSAVEGVFIDDGTDVFSNYDTTQLDYFDTDYLYESNQEKKEKVLHLHEYLTNQKSSKNLTDVHDVVTISYLLDNGKKMSRVYSKLPEDDDLLLSEIDQVGITPFSLTRDFLYNIKEDKVNDLTEISFFDTGESSTKIDNKGFRVLAQDYKNHTEKLKEDNKMIIENTGIVPVQLSTGSEEQLLSGQSSIYNQALKNYLKNNDISFENSILSDSDITGLYEIDLNNIDNQSDMFSDLKEKPVKELKKDYGFKELEGPKFGERVEQLENFEFDSAGSKLLIITDKPYSDDDPLYAVQFTVVMKD